VIHPKSASYPVHGAALAAGVDLEIAYGWVDASRNMRAILFGPKAMNRVEAVFAEGVRRHGEAAMDELASRLVEAFLEGRLKVQFGAV